MTQANIVRPPYEAAAPIRPLPESWLPLSVAGLEEYTRGQEEGAAAPHHPPLHTPIPEVTDFAGDHVWNTVEALHAAIKRNVDRGIPAGGLSANQIIIEGGPARVAAFALGLQSHTDPTETRRMTYLANPVATRLINPATGRPFEDEILVPQGCVQSSLECFPMVRDPVYIELTGKQLHYSEDNLGVREVTDYRRVYDALGGAGFVGAPIGHEIRHLNGRPSALEAVAQHPYVPPSQPHPSLHWRPVELKQQYRDSIKRDNGASWGWKIPLTMLDAIHDGTYLRHYIPENTTTIIV